MTPILFLGFGALLVATALMVVLHKHPVTSALFLVLSFCSLAGIYLLLQAEFIGMVQIIVYAGAIMVLFLFVIMYLNLTHDVERGAHIAVRRGIGWMVGALLLLFAALLAKRGWAPGPEAGLPPAILKMVILRSPRSASVSARSMITNRKSTMMAPA